MGTLSKTYQVTVGAAAPFLWASYEALVTAQWEAILGRMPPVSEREVQSFLEEHPCLIPGAFGLLGGRSGHYPYWVSVIAQAPLPSYDRRVPDFLWLAKNSEVDEPVLVEIEAPGKKWWTQAGQPTASFTQALNQITEWKAWFAVPHNIQAFKTFYGLDIDTWNGRTFRPAYALIYGRRAEANASPQLTAKRAHLTSDDVVVMTYDRLRPDPVASELFCVTKSSSGVMARTVPPTMTWSPTLAPYRRDIRGKETAIQVNKHLSADRKEFLISRAAYWDTWADTGRRGIVSVGDRE